jgi:uncharacterized protein
MMGLKPARASPRPFSLLVKPSGAACNLDCQYCFFLSKEALYPESNFRMTDELLERYLRQLLEAQPDREVTVAWQGGEPTLMGLDFFRRSVAMVEKYRPPGQTVSYTLQTNGTRLDREWAKFFKENAFLVGLSLDGPQGMHDAYRVDKGGRGSFTQARDGWEILREQDVDVNILCAVHAANGEHPLEVYRFLRDELETAFIQFIPIVERVNAEALPDADPGRVRRSERGRPLYTQSGDKVTERSIQPEQYGRFLMKIFDEWVRRDVGKVFVQTFDVALASYQGIYPLCVSAPTCGNALVLEHNGDVYSCDHFVEPGYRLGNIQDMHLSELAASSQQEKFGQAKRKALPRVCQECEVRFACHGGCPKDRFTYASDGEPGLNYLCAGYFSFFTQSHPFFKRMANLLEGGYAAAEIMDILAVEELRYLQQKLASAKPEDPCPCGSGKKFRVCHGRMEKSRLKNRKTASRR